ncbi:MAG: acyltransferase [Bacillota bacterium]
MISGASHQPALKVSLKEIIPELEIIRGLAFLAVVFQHTLGYYAQKPDIPLADAAALGMILHFTKFAVPAFVFVTGAVLFYNHYERINYSSFLLKRIKDIFVPYLLWTCIYEYYLNGVPTVTIQWLNEFAKIIITGTGIYHLWFVIMIFQFYLAYPLLLSSFKQIRNSISTRTGLFTTTSLLISLYASLMWLSYSYIPVKDIHFSSFYAQSFLIEYRDRNFLFYLFYFVIGGMAGVNITKWRSFISRSVSWNIFLFAALYILVGYELLSGMLAGRIDFNYSTPLKPSMFFYAASEILLIYGLALTIVKYKSFITVLLSKLGNYSYGGYLAHALVLIVVAKHLNQFIPPGHYVASSILTFFLCALGSTAITMILGWLPFGKLLTGPIKR